MKPLGTRFERALKGNLATYRGASSPEFGQMLAYALGFGGSRSARGKRFRSSLMFLVADGYGIGNKVTEIALAVELFHNFTLVHDDIIDHDVRRRGKPTLWKRFGVDRAIIVGDVLSFLASRAVVAGARGPRNAALARALLTSFVDVCEGQLLDLELGEAPLGSPRATERRYLAMAARKTGALMRGACEAVGITARRSPRELVRLRTFGATLGILFQIVDDYHSLWGSASKTGKDAYGDIRERKRTLPLLYAFAAASSGQRKTLRQLYQQKRPLRRREITSVRAIISDTDARDATTATIRRHAHILERILKHLSVRSNTRYALVALVKRLSKEAS